MSQMLNRQMTPFTLNADAAPSYESPTDSALSRSSAVYVGNSHQFVCKRYLRLHTEVCWWRWVPKGRSRSLGTWAMYHSQSRDATSTPTRPFCQCGRPCWKQCSAERSERVMPPSSSCRESSTTIFWNLSASCILRTSRLTVRYFHIKFCSAEVSFRSKKTNTPRPRLVETGLKYVTWCASLEEVIEMLLTFPCHALRCLTRATMNSTHAWKDLDHACPR